MKILLLQFVCIALVLGFWHPFEKFAGNFGRRKRKKPFLKHIYGIYGILCPLLLEPWQLLK